MPTSEYVATQVAAIVHARDMMKVTTWNVPQAMTVQVMPHLLAARETPLAHRPSRRLHFERSAVAAAFHYGMASIIRSA
jgi:hypothetical protein